MLAFGGDGGTADVGFQSLSGAPERDEQMIYICVNNKGYMNTGWRYEPSMLVQVARKAVEANIFPLWEFEYKKGRIVFTHSVDNPLPVKAYLSLIGKFRHLDEG